MEWFEFFTGLVYGDSYTTIASVYRYFLWGDYAVVIVVYYMEQLMR